MKHERVLSENTKRMEKLNEKVQNLMVEREKYDLQFTDTKEELIRLREEVRTARGDCEGLRRINKQLVDAN